LNGQFYNGRSSEDLHRPMRVHVRAEDGVDARLVSALAAKPAQQVGIEAHGHDFSVKPKINFPTLAAQIVARMGHPRAHFSPSSFTLYSGISFSSAPEGAPSKLCLGGDFDVHSSQTSTKTSA
jgi:hypothetical protein